MAAAIPDYPPRPKFFAHRFTRLLGKTCAGAEIGPDTCWLLTYIAHTEDAAGYARPVTFFNEDLATRLGMSVTAMRRARERAIKAGWLTYIPGAKRRAPAYFVVVPKWVPRHDDGAGDEFGDDLTLTFNPPIPRQLDAASGREAAGNRQETGREAAGNRQASGQPSSLFLAQDPLAQDPPTPTGGCGDAVGPKPEEVREEWNRHPGLTPCGEMNPHRERVVRSWAVGNPAWVSHWRAAIAFVGRTADYTGGMSSGWRADLTWFLKAENFTRVVERMLAPPAPPGTGPPADRREAERRAIIEAAKRKAG